jgi:hypothetical protein
MLISSLQDYLFHLYKVARDQERYLPEQFLEETLVGIAQLLICHNRSAYAQNEKKPGFHM